MLKQITDLFQKRELNLQSPGRSVKLEKAEPTVKLYKLWTQINLPMMDQSNCLQLAAFAPLYGKQ